MSASNSQGIHTLLEAEKEASAIVTQAREYRVKRLNNARKDAAEDISKIQARKARELEEIQKKSVNQTELTESIQKETDERMVTIREQFEKNKQAAVAKIIEAVATADVASA
ncbi:H+-ATPase G subunit-domain-containing protein [Kickxella alabastrina]|nr:H+-ATPase G subunit-domain-containing protein [Kickxella alabastrina]KAI7825590.1 H+-ATPase G subunit-domain-containing protein [Kickxella alabastrina]KAJ1945078.1 hypothetical protein GGF37_001878 [Kickxella alabastrina]